jgi:hypothetical protein
MDVTTPPSSPVGAPGPAPDAGGPAFLNGPAEKMSAAARVPFDTAGSAGSSSAAPPASASDAPAIIVSNPNAKVALLSPPPPPPRPQQPVVIPPTAEFAAALDAENKQLDVDICTKLANLRKQLTGMKDAVQRMQGIQEKTVDDRAEFEKQIQETSEAAVNHFADGVIGLLGIEVDENIKVLNTEAKKASRAARYASAALDYDDPVATDLYADYFAIVWKRRTQMATGKYWVDYVDKLVGGIEAAELSQEKGLGTRLAEGSNQILSEILGNKAMRQWLGVAPGYAQFNTLVNAYYNAASDLSEEYLAYKALDSMNKSADQYLAASTALQKKIQATVDQIKATQAELVKSSRSCTSGT